MQQQRSLLSQESWCRLEMKSNKNLWQTKEWKERKEYTKYKQRRIHIDPTGVTGHRVKFRLNVQIGW
jgi:hypothetical protein